MLTPRLLVGCTECGDPICSNIRSLIGEINCKITEISGSLYNSIIFGFSVTCDTSDLNALLHYRRILTARMMNEADDTDTYTWACSFPLDWIFSKVKLMTTGCVIQECCDVCEPIEACAIDELVITAIEQ